MTYRYRQEAGRKKLAIDMYGTSNRLKSTFRAFFLRLVVVSVGMLAMICFRYGWGWVGVVAIVRNSSFHSTAVPSVIELIRLQYHQLVSWLNGCCRTQE
jgi:hypothetical protein